MFRFTLATLLALTTTSVLAQSPDIYRQAFDAIQQAVAEGDATAFADWVSYPIEVVADGETGFVVNPYHTDALADRLIRLLTDEALRQRMAAAGRARVEEQFTLQQQTEKMLAVFERALARRRA